MTSLQDEGSPAQNHGSPYAIKESAYKSKELIT